MTLKISFTVAFLGCLAILPVQSRSLNDIVEAAQKKVLSSKVKNNVRPLKSVILDKKNVEKKTVEANELQKISVPKHALHKSEKRSISVLNAGANIASVTSNAVEKKIASEFQEKFGDNIRLVFAPWRLPDAYYVKGAAEALGDVHIRVEKIDVNKERSTMGATVTFSVQQQGKTYAKTVLVRGKLDYLIDVPVLTHPMHHGDVIQATDITWIKVSDRKSGRFLVLHEKDLIGHHPRGKYIKAGVAINKKDLVLPIFVEKSSHATALYKVGSLELKMRVKALENGHKGDTIRVLNETSNKILYATVDGPSTVILAH